MACSCTRSCLLCPLLQRKRVPLAPLSASSTTIGCTEKSEIGHPSACAPLRAGLSDFRVLIFACRMLCIAHRGGAGLFPENTLAAFRNAVVVGCDGAELDVQLSRDGEGVIFHDYRLKPEICRDAAGAWLKKPTPRIKDLTLAELRSLDIGRADPGSDYARKHAQLTARDGERIPTLVEVIELAKAAATPFRLFVELKTSFADRSLSADPKELAEATLRVLRAHGYLECTVLVGFDWPGLLHAKQLEPGIECWFTTQPQSWFGDSPPPPEDDPPGEAALQMLQIGRA